MLKNKPFFFLLLSVPVYVCYFYIVSLFDMYDRIPFRWSDVFCFSVFVLSAVLILTIKAKPVKAAGVFALHVVLLLLAVFDAGTLHIAKEQWVIYGSFCLLPLVLLEMIDSAQILSEKKEKGRRRKSSETLTKMVLFFSGCLLLAAAFGVGCFLSEKGPLFVKFGPIGLTLILLFLFFLVCAIRASDARIDVKEKRICEMFSGLLCAMSACSALLYILFLNDFTIDYVKVVFPVFLPAVILFDRRPVMKEIVFGKYA